MTICRTCQSSRSGQLRHRAATPGISSCPPTIRKLATMVMEKRQAGKQSSIPKMKKTERKRTIWFHRKHKIFVVLLHLWSKLYKLHVCGCDYHHKLSSSLNGLDRCDACVCLMLGPVLNFLSELLRTPITDPSHENTLV